MTNGKGPFRSTAATAWVLVAACATVGLSATYYIAPDGDDEADGSLEFPWKTPGVVEDYLSLGDTVKMQPGVYNCYFSLNRTTGLGSSWEDVIRWEAVDDEDRPVFQRMYIEKDGPGYQEIDGISLNTGPGSQTDTDYIIQWQDTPHLRLSNFTATGYLSDVAVPLIEYGMYLKAVSAGQGYGDYVISDGIVTDCSMAVADQDLSATAGQVGEIRFERVTFKRWGRGPKFEKLHHNDGNHWVRLIDCELTEKMYGYGTHGTMLSNKREGYFQALRLHCHGGGGSRGDISGAYVDQVGWQYAQHDIDIRDCLMYNSTNNHTSIWFIGLSHDCNVVGNTIITHRQSEALELHQERGSAITLLNIETQINPVTEELYPPETSADTGIVIANNICEGKLAYSADEFVDEVVTGNIVWAWNNLAEGSIPAGNLAICHDDVYHTDPKTSEPFNPNYMDDVGSLWAGGPLWATNHCLLYVDEEPWPVDMSESMLTEYQLASDSQAIGYGDPAVLQVGETDQAGVLRDSLDPDSGAYEFQSEVMYYLLIRYIED